MKVKLMRARWDHSQQACYAISFQGTFSSVEALPRWIQERYAVLRLFDNDEESPLGAWIISSSQTGSKTLFLYIVPQPGDPEWEAA